jgi:hypothetical protein
VVTDQPQGAAGGVGDGPNRAGKAVGIEEAACCLPMPGPGAEIRIPYHWGSREHDFIPLIEHLFSLPCNCFISYRFVYPSLLVLQTTNDPAPG